MLFSYLTGNAQIFQRSSGRQRLRLESKARAAVVLKSLVQLEMIH
jgi:hypothetical protein